MGHTSASRLYVLTGAPGSGKTAILDRLRAEFRCVDEPAREVLAEQRASGGRGTWDQDPSLLRAPPRSSARSRSTRQRVDQGRRSSSTAASPIASCTRSGPGRTLSRAGWPPMPSGISHTCSSSRRGEPSTRRTMSGSCRSRTPSRSASRLRDVYERSGYTLVPVPPAQIDDRAAFVREFIGRCA